MGWHDAELGIDGTHYRAEATFILDDDTCCSFLMVDFRRYKGTHYSLILGQGQETCDCPHSTFVGADREGFRCKHVACILEALDQLEALERLEWRLSVVIADVTEAAER
jgi:hypothetical protein